MNAIDSAAIERLHRSQAEHINRYRDLSHLVRDELEFRLQLHDTDCTRDFVDWIAENREAITEMMDPGELSHKEMIDRWRMKWIDRTLLEGWAAVDELYRLGVSE